MPYFDRFDICEAYDVIETAWHLGGWLRERKSNQRRRESTGCQLTRMQWKPRGDLTFATLTENGKDIYAALCTRYRFEDEDAKAFESPLTND